MTQLLRSTAVVAALFLILGIGTAATPKEIEAAVKKGSAFLKDRYRNIKPGQIADGEQGVGTAALVGLALLESGTPADDPAVKVITSGIRDAAFTETQTYHIALCLLFLDRLGDPGDVPVIQMLGVRLLAGQNPRGGWTYECIRAVSQADERLLRTSLTVAELKAGASEPPPATKPPVGKKGAATVVGTLHPEVEKYAARLAASRIRDRGDDNSNTQFGVLGVWTARKHGVPVEPALDRIEKRFMTTQTASGGWPYSGFGEGSPSMTCAGLLGLATAIGRREERRLNAQPARKDDILAVPVPKAQPKPVIKSDDPFYNPPPATAKSEEPKPGANPPPNKQPGQKKAAVPKAPLDARDAAVQHGLASLGRVLKGNAPVGQGKRNRIVIGDGVLGDRDYYFLWSLERVGIIFGLDKIGGVDWYDAGASELVPLQNANGSWGKGDSGREVETAFALLFLARSNLARDLSSKVQKDGATAELRAGSRPAVVEPAPMPMSQEQPSVATKPSPPATVSPEPTTDDPKVIAAELLGASDANWEKTLARIRDTKGSAYTQGLVQTIHTLDGNRLKSAREALAERLTRMTAETLRSMMKEKDAELRRGAVLAMAMKDDKSLLPDLIAALLDDEDAVVRAAKAGLKSVTGEDFGPAAGATLTDRTAAAKAWLEWLRKQK